MYSFNMRGVRGTRAFIPVEPLGRTGRGGLAGWLWRDGCEWRKIYENVLNVVPSVGESADTARALGTCWVIVEPRGRKSGELALCDDLGPRMSWAPAAGESRFARG